MASSVPGLLRRGSIVQARFDPVEGSEQGGIRPAIVISPNDFNRHAPIVILAPLTTRNLDRIYPYEVLIEAGDGTPRQSKVLLAQIRGMAKSRILSFYGHVSAETMLQVDAALSVAVGLKKL